jgi:Tol biopolymer transport system component
VGTRLPLKLLYTMLVVLAVLATTLLILMVAFKGVNALMNPPWEERNGSPAEKYSPKGSRPSDESGKGKRLPAGEMIGFVAPDSGIYVLGLANGVKTMVLGGVPSSAEPDWSSDGRKIAFVGNGDSIWVMKADGTGRRLLQSGEAGAYSPAWSPDGEKIAFSSYSGGGNPSIQIMDVANSERESITDETEGAGNFHPGWSPDGERIVYMKQEGSSEAVQGIPVNEIYIIDADGSHENRLTRGAGDAHPAFSPDGTKIAFVSRRDSDPGIYVMNADGTNVEKLADGATDNTTPSWSPDGERVVFGSEGALGTEIRVVNAEGTGERSVTDPPTEGIDPTWLP